nr:hypothetical protein Iba_chr03cCG6960 [Ipomoea batatas]
MGGVGAGSGRSGRRCCCELRLPTVSSAVRQGEWAESGPRLSNQWTNTCPSAR